MRDRRVDSFATEERSRHGRIGTIQIAGFSEPEIGREGVEAGHVRISVEEVPALSHIGETSRLGVGNVVGIGKHVDFDTLQQFTIEIATRIAGFKSPFGIEILEVGGVGVGDNGRSKHAVGLVEIEIELSLRVQLFQGFIVGGGRGIVE